MSNALAKGNSTSLARDWRPFFDSLVSQMDRTFSDAFAEVWVPSTNGFSPPIDVIEEENEYRVVAEVPGMSSDQLDISYEDGVLTIAGEKQEERQAEAKGYHYYERSHGKFSRSLTLPHRYLKTDEIKAECKDGVLTVTIPRLPKDAHVKKISVNSS